MRADVNRELEELVGEIGTLAGRLRGYDQPLATQLLEMAVLEIRSRMYGIADDELQALVDTLSGQRTPIPVDTTQPGEPAETPARIMPSPRVIALDKVSRGKCKRRS